MTQKMIKDWLDLSYEKLFSRNRDNLWAWVHSFKSHYQYDIDIRDEIDDEMNEYYGIIETSETYWSHVVGHRMYYYVTNKTHICSMTPSYWCIPFAAKLPIDKWDQFANECDNEVWSPDYCSLGNTNIILVLPDDYELPDGANYAGLSADEIRDIMTA